MSSHARIEARGAIDPDGAVRAIDRMLARHTDPRLRDRLLDFRAKWQFAAEMQAMTSDEEVTR